GCYRLWFAERPDAAPGAGLQRPVRKGAGSFDACKITTEFSELGSNACPERGGILSVHALHQSVAGTESCPRPDRSRRFGERVLKARSRRTRHTARDRAMGIRDSMPQ